MTQKRPPVLDDARRRTGQFSGIQVMFAAILAIGLFLAIDFSTRIASGQSVQQAYDRVRIEIEQLRRVQEELIAQRDYVRSDAYVAQWARSQGRMILPGEILVVPVPAAAAVVDTQPTPTPPIPVEALRTTPATPEPWKVWWSLFFDSPPPEFWP